MVANFFGQLFALAVKIHTPRVLLVNQNTNYGVSDCDVAIDVGPEIYTRSDRLGQNLIVIVSRRPYRSRVNVFWARDWLMDRNWYVWGSRRKLGVQCCAI
jgi:hypothetical protein